MFSLKGIHINLRFLTLKYWIHIVILMVAHYQGIVIFQVQTRPTPSKIILIRVKIVQSLAPSKPVNIFFHVRTVCILDTLQVSTLTGKN